MVSMCWKKRNKTSEKEFIAIKRLVKMMNKFDKNDEKMVDYGKRDEKCPKCNSDLLDGNDFQTGEDYIRCSNPKCNYFFSWGK